MVVLREEIALVRVLLSEDNALQEDVLVAGVVADTHPDAAAGADELSRQAVRARGNADALNQTQRHTVRPEIRSISGKPAQHILLETLTDTLSDIRCGQSGRLVCNKIHGVGVSGDIGKLCRGGAIPAVHNNIPVCPAPGGITNHFFSRVDQPDMQVVHHVTVCCSPGLGAGRHRRGDADQQLARPFTGRIRQGFAPAGKQGKRRQYSVYQ